MTAVIREKLDALSIEELANTITHGFGLFLSVIGFAVLVILASFRGDRWSLLSCTVYGLSLVVLYAASTFYHSTTSPRLKKNLQIVDHCCIYLLIAGSYTPFVLLFVYNTTGLVLLSLLWVLTFVGVFIKIYYTGKYEKLSTAVYVMMGWMLIPVAKTFFAQLSTPVIALIIAGGVLYSIGVIFYLWRKFFYHHVVWHLFVLSASICHYAAILIAVS